jgi:hypothetical protein
VLRHELVFSATADAYPWRGIRLFYCLDCVAVRQNPETRHANTIFVPAVFCLMYAAWQWLVLIKSPEADIRVDLLLIWPIQAILNMWTLGRTFRL